MAYVYSNGRIYWSNGQVRGFVLADKSIYPWGIDTPPIQPLLQTTATGGLDAGRYQVAITWMRDINGDAGEESGALQARTEERRVGEACVSTCIYRRAPYH